MRTIAGDAPRDGVRIFIPCELALIVPRGTEGGLEDTFFADDLNLFRAFPASTANNLITETLEEGQAAVHTWGGKKSGAV